MRLDLIVLYSIVCTSVGHVPDYISTPADRYAQYCVMAESCIHDTIPVCGKSNDDFRSFLDLCDLLEYVCDTNEVFLHIEDTETCPELKKDNAK